MAEPLFILTRKRRLLFVNRAWEALTGVPASEARGLACTRRGSEATERRSVVARALWPPPEVLDGKPAHARRRVEGPAPAWWDIEFFPLGGPDGVLCILGKIHGAPLAPAGAFLPFPEALRKLHEQMAKGLPPDKAAELWSPEKLVFLRERLASHFRIDHLDSPLPSMGRVAAQARLAGSIRTGVFLTGEPGSGKSWLARAIHQNTPARERAFAHLDCAHLPTPAIAQTLFGGGGLLQRPGFGTLYLKEPSQLPRDLQLRLFDWMEHSAAHPEGVGLHIIAGSDLPPLAEVHAGRLLEKLYGLLATLMIELPPLRERLADLPNLVDRMLERLNDAGERRVAGLTLAAWEIVREHRWQGNLRELYTMLSSCHERVSGERIDAADLPASVRQAVKLDQSRAAPPDRPMPLDALLEQVERRLIELALRRARGNKSRAAELLAVWRPRLLRRMEALGFKPGSADEHET